MEITTESNLPEPSEESESEWTLTESDITSSFISSEETPSEAIAR